jgi:hypothetical protein
VHHGQRLLISQAPDRQTSPPSTSPLPLAQSSLVSPAAPVAIAPLPSMKRQTPPLQSPRKVAVS